MVSKRFAKANNPQCPEWCWCCQLGLEHRYLDCWYYAVWEDYIVHKEFMMMTEMNFFNQQMDDTSDILHSDWVSACCSLLWRQFHTVSLVLTRSVRSVGIAQAVLAYQLVTVIKPPCAYNWAEKLWTLCMELAVTPVLRNSSTALKYFVLTILWYLRIAVLSDSKLGQGVWC